MGENVRLLDVFKKPVEQAYVYEHPGSKVVGVVVYKSNNPEADNIAKEIALQAVAMYPQYVSLDRIPEKIMKQMEKEFLLTQDIFNIKNHILKKNGKILIYF